MADDKRLAAWLNAIDTLNVNSDTFYLSGPTVAEYFELSGEDPGRASAP